MVTITGIEKLRGGRILVTLENGDKYQLLLSAFRERPVETGQEVDPEEYAHWVLLHQYKSALDKAVAMLARRACSQGEIRQKLKQTGYSDETAEMVLYKLNQNHLLNDHDFAVQWTSYRSGQKYGPRRIAQELRAKGLSSEDTASVLGEVPEEKQLENAVQIARKGFRNAREGEEPRKTRQRILTSVVRRGFGWDIARQAVEKAARENGMESDEYET